jgi:hypothetical protein
MPGAMLLSRKRGEHSNHYTTAAVRETRSGKMMQTAEFRLLASRCHTGNSSLPRTDMCDERRTIKVYTDSILEKSAVDHGFEPQSGKTKDTHSFPACSTTNINQHIRIALYFVC